MCRYKYHPTKVRSVKRIFSPPYPIPYHTFIYSTCHLPDFFGLPLRRFFFSLISLILLATSLLFLLLTCLHRLSYHSQSVLFHLPGYVRYTKIFSYILISNCIRPSYITHLPKQFCNFHLFFLFFVNYPTLGFIHRCWPHK